MAKLKQEVSLGFFVSRELREQIKDRAASDSRSVSSYLRNLILKDLKMNIDP